MLESVHLGANCTVVELHNVRGLKVEVAQKVRGPGKEKISCQQQFEDLMSRQSDSETNHVSHRLLRILLAIKVQFRKRILGGKFLLCVSATTFRRKILFKIFPEGLT